MVPPSPPNPTMRRALNRRPPQSADRRLTWNSLNGEGLPEQRRFRIKKSVDTNRRFTEVLLWDHHTQRLPLWPTSIACQVPTSSSRGASPRGCAYSSRAAGLGATSPTYCGRASTSAPSTPRRRRLHTSAHWPALSPRTCTGRISAGSQSRECPSTSARGEVARRYCLISSAVVSSVVSNTSPNLKALVKE